MKNGQGRSKNKRVNPNFSWSLKFSVMQSKGMSVSHEQFAQFSFATEFIFSVWFTSPQNDLEPKNIQIKCEMNN